MHRYRKQLLKSAGRRSVSTVFAVLVLSACGDRPPGPKPSYPPQPETVKVQDYVITAEMKLLARPAPPSPGMM